MTFVCTCACIVTIIIRMGFDSLCLKLDENNGAAPVLDSLRTVLESALADMSETASSSDVKSIDESLAGVKRKKRPLLGSSSSSTKKD